MKQLLTLPIAFTIAITGNRVRALADYLESKGKAPETVKVLENIHTGMMHTLIRMQGLGDMEYQTFPQVQRTLPPDIERGIPRECIHNSLDTAMAHDLRYAEGIALGPRVGMWVRHAWNVDEDGSVIDTTWAAIEGPSKHYIGRIIDTKDKIDHVVKLGIYEFEHDCPVVPEGGLGIDCYTQKQLDFINREISKEHNDPKLGSKETPLSP